MGKKIAERILCFAGFFLVFISSINSIVMAEGSKMYYSLAEITGIQDVGTLIGIFGLFPIFLLFFAFASIHGIRGHLGLEKTLNLLERSWLH